MRRRQSEPEPKTVPRRPSLFRWPDGELHETLPGPQFVTLVLHMKVGSPQRLTLTVRAEHGQHTVEDFAGARADVVKVSFNPGDYIYRMARFGTYTGENQRGYNVVVPADSVSFAEWK